MVMRLSAVSIVSPYIRSLFMVSSYDIKNVGSGRFLDVSEYGQGTNVVQYNDNGPTDNEKWYIALDDAGTFLVPLSI